jgi:glycosyltransferase involved in cell wall biosynthesis
MRIYWYWPFAREEDVELAFATPGPEGTLTVHALDRPGAPRVSTERVTFRAELPDVADQPEGSPRWAWSRLATYAARARARRHAIRTGAYDVAHIAFLNQYTDLVDLRRLRRALPIVTTVHDVLPHRSRLPAVVQHRLLRELYRTCGTIVVHHEDVGAELTERFEIPTERVHVVPHWVSPFRAVDDRRILSADPTVLCFGTLRRNKGIPELLAAIEAIGPERGIRFHVAGRGDARLETAVRDAAERLPHLTAEIEWITPERKRALLQDADVVVLPYTAFSSQSGVLHDAFGSHLPVVVTDVGALRSSVERAGAGWVVPPGVVDALARTLVNAVSDPEAWQRASDGARHVSIDQGPEAIGAALRTVYRRAISDRNAQRKSER